MSSMWISIATLILASVYSTIAFVEYKDYKVYNVVGRSEAEQKFLFELSQDESLDFFNLGRYPNESSRVMVPPLGVPAFEEALTQQGIYHSRLVDDISKVFAKEREENIPRNPPNSYNILERFYRHSEIIDYLDNLAIAYPSRVFLKIFGRTYEGRPMKAIIITNGDGRAGKKIIYVDAAMHAREWLAPSMALHIISELVENFDANAELLLDYDWVVLPVVNADGYEYTHEVDRLWRKTRKPTSIATCVGTDPNRNFDHEWGHDVGSSSNPCSQTYRGEKAFSEQETQVVRDIMRNYGDRLKYYLSIHTYGNYILIPWGYKIEEPDTFPDLMEVAEAGAMEIKTATGTTYSYGNTYTTIYPTSGDSADYAFGGENIPIAMVMELTRGGSSGFDPPASDIREFVTETWIGVRAMAKVVVQKY